MLENEPLAVALPVPDPVLEDIPGAGRDVTVPSTWIGPPNALMGRTIGRPTGMSGGLRGVRVTVRAT